MFRGIFDRFQKLHIIFRLIAIILAVFIAFGVVIHFIEPEAFPTIFDGIWWVIVTTSTVGYGDYVPETILGRTVAIILILLGVAFVTFYMVTLASTVFEMFNALKEGSAAYKGQEHLIIVGWNERAKNTIHQLHTMNPQLHIVLIDGTLNENPITEKNVYFVRGNPTKDETLKQANIEKAGTVLITADQHKSEHEADMQSILTLLAIKGLNSSIYSLVEIMTQEQVNNAIRAGADELVETFLLSSCVMVNCIKAHGLSKPIISLLNLSKERRIDIMAATDELIGLPFKKAVQLLVDHGLLLIGIKKGEEFFIHPSPNFEISENDHLLVIVH